MLASARAKKSVGAKHTKPITMMHKCLNTVWTSMHRVLQPEEVPAVVCKEADPLKLATRLCHEANGCWCGRKQRPLLMIQAGLVGFTKEEF